MFPSDAGKKEKNKFVRYKGLSSETKNKKLDKNFVGLISLWC